MAGKPPTPFMRFSAKHRSLLMRSDATLTMTEAQGIVGEMWAEVGDDELAELEAEYKQEMALFRKTPAAARRQASPPPPPPPPPADELSDAPQRPLSPFTRFVMQHREEMMAEEGLTEGEAREALEAVYDEVDEEEKAALHASYEAAMATYKRALKEDAKRRNAAAARALPESGEAEGGGKAGLPAPPAKPPSAYLLFCARHRGKPRLRERWRECSSDEMEALEAERAEAMKEYKDELRKFKADEQKRKAAKEAEEKKAKKAKAKGAEEKKAKGKKAREAEEKKAKKAKEKKMREAEEKKAREAEEEKAREATDSDESSESSAAEPQRPPTVYRHFCDKHRQRVKEDEGLKAGELAQRLRELWQECGDEEKEALTQECSTAMENYRAALQAFKLEARMRKRRKRKRSDEPRAAKRAKRDPHAPKKPLPVYHRFSAKIRPSLMKAEGVTYAEATQQVAELWKCVDEEERAALDAEYAVAMSKYQAALAAYQAR